jgi:hypothetical protein
MLKAIRPLITKINKNGPSLVFLNTNKYFKDKKIISISPERLYGFYTMGVCSYIKENYDTSKYIFTGASAGAWNSLYMTLKTDSSFFKNLFVKNELYKNKNVFQIEYEMKTRLLQYYTKHDFHLDRLFIRVGCTNIYTDFENLEDAIDCCIYSSRIPFIGGFTFDGGLRKYPYLNYTLHISPNIWKQNEKLDFKKDFFNLENLFQMGYQDTITYGKSTLDAKLGSDECEEEDDCSI